MSTDYLGTTLADLVTERPARLRVFERFRLDYCCGGHVKLERACASKGIAVQEVTAALAELDATPRIHEERDWAKAGLAELADHIEQTHHAYLRDELPRIAGLTEKVRAAHGSEHPEAIEVAEVFAGLKAEIESHMWKEENILFPIVRELETATAMPSFHCDTVANPIRVMELEHESAGQALARLHAATKGYSTPDDVCSTYRALMDALATLEQDLHAHIHKENYILFPRAKKRENELATAAQS